MTDQALWRPSPERTADTNLARFAAARLPAALTRGDLDYGAVHRASTEDPAWFWGAVWDELGVVGDRGETVMTTGASLRECRFFPDASLNFAENLLRHAASGGDQPAMIFQTEDRAVRELSWRELTDLVSRLQQAMQAAGVERGDRVAAWLPNLPETVAIMLAATSIGAVFSSTSPDFGTRGVLDRFGQIEPKMLFATDRYLYGGVEHDCLDRLAEIAAGLSSLTEVVLVPHLAAQVELPVPVGTGVRTRTMDDLLASIEPTEPVFDRLPFDHPLVVLYSSGTTGAPKCIVHRSGGILLKHLSEHVLHSDIRPGDRVFYFTTAGWMMWNWLASGLAAGATLVLFDGSPFHPEPAVLFDLADRCDVSFFGTSAKFLESIGKSAVSPIETHRLEQLRTIASTGSPLVAEGFHLVYERIHPDVHLASISGGTDLCGCLVAGDPTGPVHAGEIQRPALGLDIDVVDDDGATCAPGAQGELVCRNAFPSMPLGFWNDPNQERYDDAYFRRIPGCWHQGDFAAWTPSGGLVIHGRSDATLNPGGVRIGTAEIYRLVDQIDEVLESLVIAQEWDGDRRVVLFVRLREGIDLDDALVQRIRHQVRSGASPRHQPAVVLQVGDIPRTRSGKIVELAVRDVVHGRTIKNREALANPEALRFFVDRPELG